RLDTVAGCTGCRRCLGLRAGADLPAHKSMAFIMITLAFAQMFYFLVVTLDDYGGDDGLPIAARSAFGGLNIENSTVFYYLSFAILVATLLFTARMVKARFGRVIRG